MKYDVGPSSLRLYVIKNLAWEITNYKPRKEIKSMMSGSMSPIEIESLSSTAQAMTEEQLKIIAQYIPVEIMCEEISKRYRNLADKIVGIGNIMGI